MLAFPRLAGARGKFFFANIGTMPELPVWGDGLVEQSLADFSYPSRGRTDCEDELPLLIPSLASQLRPTIAVPPESAAYFGRRLVAQWHLKGS
jgi:hypothetical protein